MIRWTRMFDDLGNPQWAPEKRVARYEACGWVRADEAPRPDPQIEDVQHEREHGLDVSERPDEADHTHTEESL